MNRITQEAKKRQAVVKLANRKGNSVSARMYSVSISSVKRWKARYDGTWQSLKERSHRPNNHPMRHNETEENILKESFCQVFERYGWIEVFRLAREQGYTRSFKGMVYACKRIGFGALGKSKKPPRKHDRRYPELLTAGELVQIDVKEVPYCCLRGDLRREGKHLYQWTAIDACTRIRFIYGFEEHTPENTVEFFKLLEEAFPFRIQKVQTDNGTEFTYKYISDHTVCPFDDYLNSRGIPHILIPPRTPWHNGKVERSHRNDQRYFYDWETFSSVDQFNQQLRAHLIWSNHKLMRTFDWKSPIDLLRERLNQPNLQLSIA